MANYESFYRTNYFRVENPAAFMADFEHVLAEDLELWRREDGSFGFGGSGGIDGLQTPETVFTVWENKFSGETYGVIEPIISYETWVSPKSGEIYGLIQKVYDDAFWDFDYDSFIKMLQKHLVEGDAIIMLESGHEKLRYVTGYATIVTKTKVHCEDISCWAFGKAKEMLGNSSWVTRLEY